MSHKTAVASPEFPIATKIPPPGIDLRFRESLNDGMLCSVHDPAADAHGQTIRDELLRHLDAAHNLARWLRGNEHDVQDIVQESFLRAIRFSDQCRQESVRPWLLRIVRNTCHTWSVRN